MAAPSGDVQLVRELRARLGSSKLLLAKCTTPASRTCASRIQTAAFLSVIGSSSNLSPEQAGDLSAFAAQVGFEPGDLDEIMQSLASTNAKKKRGQRSPMQDYTAIFNYYTEGEWNAITGDSITTNDVRSILFGRMFTLGARTPSEETKRLLTSLLLILVEDKKVPILHKRKTDTHDALKTAWTAYVRRAAKPIEHIDKLQISPLEFQRARAEMYASAYRNGCRPVPSRIQIVDIEVLAHSFK